MDASDWVDGIDSLPIVASGPVATVHAVRDTAVKVLPGPMDRFTRAAFDREQDALAALVPVSAILQVDSVVQTPDGRHALCMDRCEQSLAQLLDAHGPLSIPDTLALGQAVATALAAAHDAGVVHGSVTPNNVLFRADGAPVLADFGLALRRGFPRMATHASAWAAPETLRDKVSSERGDLYGLGAVLITALVGRPPYGGRALLDRLTVPRPLRALLAELLADDPAHRPATAADVLARLTAGPLGTADTAVPVGDFDDFPAQVDRGSAQDVEDSFFAAWEQAEQAEQAGKPRRFVDRPRRSPGKALGPAAALAVLIAVPVLAGREPAVGPAAATSVAAPEDPDPAGVQRMAGTQGEFSLDPPVDRGDTVTLTWRGGTDLEYAVVVAGESLPTRVVLVNRQRSVQVSVDPVRRYCFLIQATDGDEVFQTGPRAIRGGICKA